MFQLFQCRSGNTVQSKQTDGNLEFVGSIPTAGCTNYELGALTIQPLRAVSLEKRVLIVSSFSGGPIY